MQYYPQQPITNNMAGMYSIPANPIGMGFSNIAPLGFGGYNNYGNTGGYYTGYYNNFNPYYIQQQQELQRAQIREHQRNQTEMFQRLYKIACSYSGEEVTQEALDFYEYKDPYEVENVDDLTFEQQTEYNELKKREVYKQQQQQIINSMQCQQPIPYINTVNIAYLNGYNQIFNQYRQSMPEDIGLVEYLNSYGRKDYMSALETKAKAKQSDLTQLYNKGAYNSLLNINKNGLFGNALDPNASIDDQEVRLPNAISERSRQERRARFMQALFANNEGRFT